MMKKLLHVSVCQWGAKYNIYCQRGIRLPRCGSAVKNLPANAGDAGDMCSIPGSVTFLEEDMATYSSILAWRIPWTEEAGGLQSIGLQKSWTRLSIWGDKFLQTRGLPLVLQSVPFPNQNFILEKVLKNLCCALERTNKRISNCEI